MESTYSLLELKRWLFYPFLVPLLVPENQRANSLSTQVKMNKGF